MCLSLFFEAFNLLVKIPSISNVFPLCLELAIFNRDIYIIYVFSSLKYELSCNKLIRSYGYEPLEAVQLVMSLREMRNQFNSTYIFMGSYARKTRAQCRVSPETPLNLA